ncbi:MAG TPA: hypothetical protein VGC66_19550 [Pyrinomonadaceae bacterium]|jgi:hypothetical protein
MRTTKAERLILLSTLLLFFATPGFAQTESDSHLRVIPSPLKLQGAGVRFAGKPVKSVSSYEEKLVYNGVAYYFSDDDLDGLVAEDLKSGARVIYEPTELAIAAGWLKKSTKKKVSSESDDDNDAVRNYIRGYARSGDVIWMGTDGFGVLAFDTKKKVWARFDSEAQPLPGRRSHHIFYADEDYIFAGGFHVYSNKHKRWLKIDGIPTRYVRSFGYSGWQVQLPWSLTKYAKEKFLPLGVYPEYMALWTPEKVTMRDDNEAYIFEFTAAEAPTEFTIEKWQLEWAFSQMELNPAPQQSTK